MIAAKGRQAPPVPVQVRVSFHMPLLPTLVATLPAALLPGVLARELRLPPVGCLLAGVMIGPHAPGHTGDLALAQELPESGIILPMFGVGLHLSPRELLEARRVALPGALAEMAVVTLPGWGAARL